MGREANMFAPCVLVVRAADSGGSRKLLSRRVSLRTQEATRYTGALVSAESSPPPPPPPRKKKV